MNNFFLVFLCFLLACLIVSFPIALRVIKRDGFGTVYLDFFKSTLLPAFVFIFVYFILRKFWGIDLSFGILPALESWVDGLFVSMLIDM